MDLKILYNIIRLTVDKFKMFWVLYNISVYIVNDVQKHITIVNTLYDEGFSILQ